MDLADFLKDTPSAAGSGGGSGGGMTMSWADETDDSYIDRSMSYKSGQKAVINLPTAPRAARQVEVDLSRVPEYGPYTAFLGNLPYDCNEEILQDFFKNQKVANIRLPIENGRFKGFGYIEFADRGSLIEALKKSDEMLNRRAIRIDVADQQGKDQGMSGGYGRRNDRYTSSYASSGGPDPTESNWRTAAASNDFPPQRGGYNYRGPPRDDFRRDDNDQRGGGGYGRQWSQDSGGYGNRRGGSGSGGYDDYNRSNSRDGGGFRRNSGYNNQRDGGFPRRDYGDRGGEVFNQREAPVERKTLKLQPRQKPVSTESTEGSTRSPSIFGNAKPVDTTKREQQIEEKIHNQEKKVAVAPSVTARAPQEPKRSNIFGAAKPVDTRNREKEIEQKMNNMRIDRSSARNSGSDKGGYDHRYETRSSSGRVSSTSSRHGDEEFAEDDSVKGMSRTGSVSDPPAPAAPVKPEYKPAPTPSQNAWAKKLTPSDSLPNSSMKKDERVHAERREEAEGNDNGTFERTPEGAAADDRPASQSTAMKTSSSSATKLDKNTTRYPPGDGRESQGARSYSRDKWEGKTSYAGQRDDRHFDNRRGNENRRRGDGETGSSTGYQQRHRGGSSSSSYRRDEPRDGRRDGGYDQNKKNDRSNNDPNSKPPRGKKAASTGIKQLDPTPTVDFVEKSKFSILADENSDSTGEEADPATTTTADADTPAGDQ